MNAYHLIRSHWRHGLVGSALAALVGLGCLFCADRHAGFIWLPFADGLENLSYDLPFAFRPDVPVKEHDVMILYMDETSHSKLGMPWDRPWHRSRHAQLIESLTERGVKAIAFDILFLESTNSPPADARLVQAAKTSGKVVTASMMTPKLHDGQLIGWQLTSAFQELKDIAAHGAVEEAGEGKTSRSHYHNAAYEEPGLSWKVAQLTTTNALPDPFRKRWLNYYGPPGIIPGWSYYLAFESNSIASVDFSNKVVFVGAKYSAGFSGGLGTDDFNTPYTRFTGRKSPGVEINATAYLNLVRGDWLRRLPPWEDVALVLVMACMFGFGLAGFRPMTAAGLSLAGAGLVAAGAIAVVWRTHVWVPWMITVGAQIPVALGWSILAHTRRLQREKHGLAQALAMATRGQGSPAMAAGSPASATNGIHLPQGSPSPFLSPTPGAGMPLAAVRDPARPVVPDHEMLRCIGKGGFGEVFLARDIIGTFHAVKVIYRQTTHDPGALEREFKGIKNFTPISRSHPGFVHILHVGRNEGGDYIYCVMELGDDDHQGQEIDPATYAPKTLASELKKRGRFPLPEGLRLCIQLAEALDYLHIKNLIHRDIKPANIIFVRGTPKFADIGLVTEVTAVGGEITIVGTPHRMAPEGPGQPSADVYGLGKVLYEVGFGLDVSRFPELPTQVIRDSDPSLFEFNRIVMKACESDVKRRYQTADELCVDLVALEKCVSAGVT